MASGSSSSSFFGIREEDLQNQLKQHQLQQQPPPAMPISSAAAPPAAPPPKKKRNLPGTPNPDAEVIALSPKTLMATNRFICEVCNKGFQREQNLQLHRRGHNLPWKLRQKSTKEVKRRVYLCPEPTCVHHDPSRALGDLTGIKKHFCRKHGEKKWKCDKCSKRYAVQSDWKAHSKTCGTREYRCDCGTLFSRRDSFITHRAFCDALAQESARIPTGLGPIGSHLYGSSSNNSMGLGLSQVSSQLSSLHDHQTPSADLLRLGGGGGGSGTQFNHLLSAASNPSSSFRPPQPSSGFFLGGQNQDFADESQSHHHSLLHSKAFHGLMLPDLQSSNNNNSNAVSSPAAANLFNLGFFSNSSTASSITNSSSNNNNNNGQNSHLLIPDQFNSSNGGTAVQQAAAAMFSGGLMGDHMGGSGVSSIFNASSGNEPVLPQMSATALLQKAAQMGATTTTTSNGGPSLLRAFGSSSSSSTPKTTIFRNPFGDGGGGGGGGGESMRLQLDSEAHFQDLMNSLTNGNANGIFGNNNGGGVSAFGGSNCTGEQENAGFGGGFGGNMPMMDDEAKLHQTLSLGGGGMGGSDRLTRDFLGVGGVVRGMGGGAMSQREQQQQHQRQHHGLDIGSGMKSANDPRSFAGGALQ